MKIYRPKEVSDSSWACNLRYLSIDQHMLGKAAIQFLELLLHYIFSKFLVFRNKQENKDYE